MKPCSHDSHAACVHAMQRWTYPPRTTFQLCRQICSIIEPRASLSLRGAIVEGIAHEHGVPYCLMYFETPPCKFPANRIGYSSDLGVVHGLLRRCAECQLCHRDEPLAIILAGVCTIATKEQLLSDFLILVGRHLSAVATFASHSELLIIGPRTVASLTGSSSSSWATRTIPSWLAEAKDMSTETIFNRRASSPTGCWSSGRSICWFVSLRSSARSSSSTLFLVVVLLLLLLLALLPPWSSALVFLLVGEQQGRTACNGHAAAPGRLFQLSRTSDRAGMAARLLSKRFGAPNVRPLRLVSSQ